MITDQLVDEIEKLIGEYWDIAIAEGRASAQHDTEDHVAAIMLSRINARLQILRQLARNGEVAGSVLTALDEIDKLEGPGRG